MLIFFIVLSTCLESRFVLEMDLLGSPGNDSICAYLLNIIRFFALMYEYIIILS